MPTAYIGKWWANDKAVCPPYISKIRLKNKHLTYDETNSAH